MKTYTRVLSRLYNTPLIIEQSKLDIISNNVTLKLLQGEPVASIEAAKPDRSAKSKNKIGVIEVFDSLVSKGAAGDSGFTSYQSIKSNALAAIQAGVTKLGFYIDSPGGELSGNFPLTDFIRSIPEVYGVETFAFTDGSANSGAYSIASATQHIYATETSMAGSIGVIMDLVDVTKLDADKGIEHTILRSKSEKAIYNPHEKISQEVIDKYMVLLDKGDILFNNEVVKNRPNLTVDAIKSMKGDTFLAEEALALGLIDSIVATLDEALAIETSKPTTTVNIGSNMTLEETKTKLAETESELARVKVETATAIEKAIAQERQRALSILESGETLKISTGQIKKRIAASSSAEDSLDIFTAIAESIDANASIDTSTGVEATADTVAKPEEKLEVAGMSVTVSEILKAAQEAAGVK